MADPDLHRRHRHRILVRTVLGVVVAVALVVGGPWVYARFLVREAPDPLELSSASPSAEPEVPTGPVDIDGSWVVEPGSEAGYRLREVLSGEEVTVVGRTQDVSGQLEIEDGLLTEAVVVVRVGTISSDEAARDAFFRRALDTSTYPEATFALSQPVDVSMLGESADPVTVSATGTLTLHGVSRPVVAVLDAQRTPTGVEVVGGISVTLADFGLTAPDLGWVVVDPTGTVEVRLLVGR